MSADAVMVMRQETQMDLVASLRRSVRRFGKNSGTLFFQTLDGKRFIVHGSKCVFGLHASVL